MLTTFKIFEGFRNFIRFSALVFTIVMHAIMGEREDIILGDLHARSLRIYKLFCICFARKLNLT